MQNKLLIPEQIIALKDYPLHNEQILKIYFRVFQMKQGKILPPCPVIHKSAGIPYTRGENSKSNLYNVQLKKFLEEHPRAEYFLLDGNHKSTAAALSRQPLPVIVLQKNHDFKYCKKLAKEGKIFGWYAIGSSISGALKELEQHYLKHFSEKPAFYFYTVAEKAKELAKNNDVSEYMIKAFKKLN